MNKRKLCKLLSLFLVAIMMITIVPEKTYATEKKESTENVTDRSTDVMKLSTGYQQPVGIDMGVQENLQESRSGVGATTYAASTWDTYSSDYFYNQMSAAQQSFYNNLYTVCMKLLSGTYAANSETYYTQSGEPVQCYMTDYAAAGSLSSTAAQYVVVLFQTNNPQFYFVNDMFFYSYDYSGHYSYALGVYDDFANGTTRASYSNQIKNTITSWVATIKSQSDVVAMERKAHDLVIANTTYLSSTYNQSCAGVFLDGEAVCAGYAEAYEVLCNAVGIETIAVTSSSHEWNKTKLYGRWYVVDCTWDDQGTIIYDFFNKSDAMVEAQGAHTLESFWSGFNVPVASLNTVDTSATESYVYDGVDYSAVFDADYYISTYADIRTAYGADKQQAFAHFISNGMKEGRQGCASFNVYSYKNRYKDLRTAFGNNLTAYYMHYINNGKAEGRTAVGDVTITDGVTIYNGVDYSSVYHYSYYIANNVDVAKAYPNDDLSVLAHFVNSGMAEQRQASAGFNVKSYFYLYPDLRRSFETNWKSYYLHYMSNGKNEGRVATGITSMQGASTVYNGVNYSSVYDFNYYISKYPDIKAAYGTDETAALAHFVTFGMREGRQAIASFEVNSYKLRYKDLRATYGYDLASYYLHYISFGKAEGRLAAGNVSTIDGVTVYNGVDYSAVYNYNYYVNAYADIKAAYGTDDLAVLAHFVNSGMREGRQAVTSFNVNSYRNRYVDLRNAYGNDLASYYIHYLQFGIREGRIGS